MNTMNTMETAMINLGKCIVWFLETAMINLGKCIVWFSVKVCGMTKQQVIDIINNHK